MKYKVYSGNQKYIIETSDENKYIIHNAEPLDLINLSFNAENQSFNIKILNPSNHTKYLLSHGRLGVFLCKRLCTERGHIHQSHAYEGVSGQGPGYIKVKDNEGYPYWRRKQRTRMAKYSRWSRIGIQPIIINSLEQNIDIQTIIEELNGSFYLHDHNGYSSRFLKIKAQLCCIGINRMNNSSADRIYKTKSKIIKLRTVGHYNEAEFEPAIMETHYSLNLNEHWCMIYFDKLTGWFRKAYNEGQLWVGLKIYGPQWGVGSKAYRHGGWYRGYIPKRASLYNCIQNIELRDRGHRRIETSECINDIPYYYEWDHTNIRPKETLSSLLKKHHDPVVINNYFSIVVFYKPTGTVLKHIVNEIPYTYTKTYD